jgi:hypothetical protein
MLVTNLNDPLNALLIEKSQFVLDLYHHLLSELNKIGPIQEKRKLTSVSFENRNTFASTMIRNSSIKLVLRTNHRISNPRILNTERVSERFFDHTILLNSKNDVDDELKKWLEDAYKTGK